MDGEKPHRCETINFRDKRYNTINFSFIILRTCVSVFSDRKHMLFVSVINPIRRFKYNFLFSIRLLQELPRLLIVESHLE